MYVNQILAHFCISKSLLEISKIKWKFKQQKSYEILKLTNSFGHLLTSAVLFTVAPEHRTATLPAPDEPCPCWPKIFKDFSRPVASCGFFCVALVLLWCEEPTTRPVVIPVVARSTATDLLPVVVRVGVLLLLSADLWWHLTTLAAADTGGADIIVDISLLSLTPVQTIAYQYKVYLCVCVCVCLCEFRVLYSILGEGKSSKFLTTCYLTSPFPFHPSPTQNDH